METETTLPPARMQRTDQRGILSGAYACSERAAGRKAFPIAARIWQSPPTMARAHSRAASAMRGLSRRESSAHYGSNGSASHRWRQHKPRRGEWAGTLQAPSLAKNGGITTRIREKLACQLKLLIPMGCKKL